MFDAPRRPLVFPLKNALVTQSETPEGDVMCAVPVFPEDSDEKVTVLFRLSLNEFVALASAVDVGSDIAFGTDAIKLWWLWSASLMCASFCEEMVLCLEDPESPFAAALAAALVNNPLLASAIADALPQTGNPVPGRPLTPTQSASDMLPTNIRDEDGCIDDALWGACLWLVQSGNRVITDFFEILENASNTLEASSIISGAIPAAGQYASAAFEFADQMQENIAEGYTAAYTEAYETGLACELFCRARMGCELTPDMLVQIMQDRLPDPVDAITFQTVMVYVGEAPFFVGAEIADVAFYVYFTGIKFGQQFGEVIGVRPLTELMGLGADQLASDNWETLCDCAPFWCYQWDFLTDDGGYESAPYLAGLSIWQSGNGWTSDDDPGQYVDIRQIFGGTITDTTDADVSYNIPSGNAPALVIALFNSGSLVHFEILPAGIGTGTIGFVVPPSVVYNEACWQISDTAPFDRNFITGVVLVGENTLPANLAGGAEC